MSRTKHQNPTEFAYPVGRICGKISRHSKVVHACTASGKQITYMQGERNYLEHPVSEAELARQALFTRRATAVAARYDRQSATYQADMQAYLEQLKNAEKPIHGFQAYLWSLVKAEITE